MINSGDAELNEVLKRAESIKILLAEDGKGQELFHRLKEYDNFEKKFMPIASAEMVQVGRDTTLHICHLKGGSTPEDFSFDKICGIIAVEAIEDFGIREKTMWLVKDRQIVRFKDNG